MRTLTQTCRLLQKADQHLRVLMDAPSAARPKGRCTDMRASRGMGCINPAKMPKGTVKQRRDNTDFTEYAEGGEAKSKVNAAGNYTKPGMRKSLFEKIKGQAVQGTAAGQWSARKAQLLAKQYKSKGGGYRD
jgi:hypothetical protein